MREIPGTSTLWQSGPPPSCMQLSVSVSSFPEPPGTAFDGLRTAVVQNKLSLVDVE